MSNAEIHIYTDGACSGNPGRGGYGIVMEWVNKNFIKEFAQGYRLTTNNRMELMAVIEGLKKLKRKHSKVKIFSDSKYVIDAVEKKWVFSWVKKEFKNKKNPDLWKKFLTLYETHEIRFQWIKGHSGHSQNERCDTLAVKASESDNLLIDTVFESNLKNNNIL